MQPYNLKFFIAFFFLGVCLGIPSLAQVGIGTSSPRGMLDLNSSSYGLVYPRVALTKTNVPAPVVNPKGGNLVAGTVVYNTNTTSTGSHDVYPGVYVFDGTDWVPQFILEHSALFEQTPLDFSVPLSGGFIDVPGLENGTSFMAKYTGTYRIEANFNFGAGKVKDPVSAETIRMATQEGYFRFWFNSVSYDIYTHSYSIRNNNTGTDFNQFRHDSSLILYVNLKAGQSYPLRLQVDMVVSNSNDYSSSSNGHVGIGIPCSVEFTYIKE